MNRDLQKSSRDFVCALRSRLLRFREGGMIHIGYGLVGLIIMDFNLVYIGSFGPIGFRSSEIDPSSSTNRSVRDNR